MSTYIKARGTTATGWQRPSDWIAIPSIAPGEQVFYGLVAVYNVIGGNRVAFTFAGNYTVDWGDGSALENVLSGVKAEHSYTYASVSNPTSEGWRQALIKVIPTGVANITTVNLQQTPTGISNGRTSQFMDIVMSVPNVTGTNLYIGTNANSIGSFTNHRVLERVDIREIGAITSLFNMFANCSSLQSVPLFNTASVNNMTSMFVSCISLQSVPLFNTASVTSMQAMFSGCTFLQSVPLFNTASVTNMPSMFVSCISLQSVPLFNTANVTSMNLMFNGAGSLYEANFNMASVTNTTQMFVNIVSLQKFTATGLTRGITISGNLLSATEINNFFTSLGTASGAQTIVVTGNPGAATCDVTIATLKGFIVTI